MAVVLKDLMSETGPLKNLSIEYRFQHLLMCIIWIGVF
jgi:hypothetical protein